MRKHEDVITVFGDHTPWYSFYCLLSTALVQPPFSQGAHPEYPRSCSSNVHAANLRILAE